MLNKTIYESLCRDRGQKSKLKCDKSDEKFYLHLYFYFIYFNILIRKLKYPRITRV